MSVFYRDFISYSATPAGYTFTERLLDGQQIQVAYLIGKRTRIIRSTTSAKLVWGDRTVNIETKGRTIRTTLDGSSFDLRASFHTTFPILATGTYRFEFGGNVIVIRYPHFYRSLRMVQAGTNLMDISINGQSSKFVYYERHARDHERTPMLTPEACALIGADHLPLVVCLCFWVGVVNQSQKSP
jgi:hypothetical protein